MIKRNIRKGLVSIIVVSFSILLCGSAYAGEWSESQGWGSQSASYSPDYGNTSFYKYTSDGQLKVSPKVRFKFDSSAVTAIHDYYDENEWYYTMDISITDPYDETKNAFSYFYSDLPGCHYDLDDDPEPFGNGYYDETEVISLRSDLIQADHDYRFESYYYVLSELNDPYFAFTSQMSEESLFGEYNVVYYQTHLTRKYPW